METVMRTFQKIFGECGCHRRHQSEPELYGEYNLLQNHDKTTTTMPEKQSTKKKNKVTPHGCLCVYVGAARQRFAIKIEYASHPLFMALLKDAAADTKNGNSVHNNGPLFVRCDVEEFHEALSEIMIADFDSSVSDNIPTSSYPSRSANKHGWARRLFKIPTAFKSKLN